MTTTLPAYPEPMLKEVPMFSTDEVEIELNSILYRVRWSSGYNYEKEGAAEIEALRVFFVNNSARIFRTKCPKGCEEVWKMADGCQRDKLFSKFENAVKTVREMIAADAEQVRRKIVKAQDTFNHINNESARIKKMSAADVKLPKAVRT